jgi:hypothetical protein
MVTPFLVAERRSSMPLDHTTVAIVLDPDYAGALHSLARRAPMWVIDSPLNRPVIEQLWTTRRRERTDWEITVFREVPGLSPETHLARVLKSVEDQIDLDPDQPRHSAIEVIGLGVSAGVPDVLRERGFGPARETANGFRAVRSR